MKKTWIILALLIVLSGVSTVFAQSIPPRTDGSTPDSIPTAFEPSTDYPGRPGCYLVEGGANFYYKGGSYNKAGNEDSDGSSYAPWGLNINPSAEFFLFDMVAFGGTAKFNYEQDGADKQLMIGVGPIFSIYYNKRRTIIPFFSIYGLYGHTNQYYAKAMYWTDQTLTGGVKAGVTFMLSRQAGVFIDVRFEYSYHRVATPPLTTQSTQTGWEASSYLGFKFFVF
jgi:hypothetical protein